MAPKRKFSLGFTLCMLFLLLVALAGVALIVYGSATNGLPLPKLPGSFDFAWAEGTLCG